MDQEKFVTIKPDTTMSHEELVAYWDENRRAKAKPPQPLPLLEKGEIDKMKKFAGKSITIPGKPPSTPPSTTIPKSSIGPTEVVAYGSVPNPNLYPYCAIGKLFFDMPLNGVYTPFAATAFVVNNLGIMTAAHN
ncbi:hypothetical protein, partial [Nitrosomonas nitrosa]|uniref:hypothetical protein n=1 Tax=Nitrosomonas nitrosa TaxID=52442 RepID=UPI0023F930D3